MGTVKKTIRIDEKLNDEIEKIAQENNTNFTQIIENSLKLYRDYNYMQSKASIINQDVINVVKAISNSTERNINYKTNKYLSEIAIQSAITNMVLARGVNLTEKELQLFRIKAVSFLRENQRILRLEEVCDA